MRKSLFLFLIISCFCTQAWIVSANSAPTITTNWEVSQGVDIINNVVYIKRTEYKVWVATTQVSDVDGGDIDFRITSAYDGHLFNMLICWV